jgi:hypothetical protein
MKRRWLVALPLVLFGALGFVGEATASGGTWNCGPSLRLQISTNLGPNPALITQVANGVTLFSGVAVSHTSFYSGATSGTWSATPSGAKACVV